MDCLGFVELSHVIGKRKAGILNPTFRCNSNTFYGVQLLVVATVLCFGSHFSTSHLGVFVLEAGLGEEILST